MRSGVIRLYSLKEDNVLHQLVYSSPYHRSVIIEDWKKRYGPGYDKCYIQIIPTFDATKITKNGLNSTNLKKRYKIQEDKFVRPKAIYTNTKSPYGIADELHSKEKRKCQIKEK